MFEPIFPQELLTKSHNERLDYFKRHSVTHRLFEQAFQELSFAIQDAQPGTLIFLYGPSGVGKTTMLKLLEAVLTKQMLPQLETDLERIPVVSVNAVETESGTFDWKGFFQSLLIKLNDPLPENKLDLTLPEDIYKHNKQLLESGDLPSTRKYRRAAENMLKRRRPLAVLVDEAQHIGKVVSSRKLLNQLNVVKCLANESDSVYVMSGTYELIPFLNLNDQLSRRSINIQFPRYKVENEDDRKSFISALVNFQRYLPLEEMPDLVSRWDYFYERTIGCIGTLNDWLERALSLALRNGGRQMNSDHWEKRSPLLSQCQKKFFEVKNAELSLLEAANGWGEFREKLGLAGIETGDINSGYEALMKESNDSTETKSSKRKKRVGTRNPHRDSIGINRFDNQ
jgi:energy-coupling factor transporter ATP-binding protein EcfA2